MERVARKVSGVAALLLVISIRLFAQEATRSPQLAVRLQSGDTPVVGQCLTKEELDLNNALHALNRPTHGREAGADADDPLRFDPQYFVGTWKIDGTLPESPLGPAGTFEGTETIRHVEGCAYEGVLEAKLGDLSFRVKSLMYYDRREGYLVRLEQDSRGFQVLKAGRIGGDSGGYFSQHWETPPVTLNENTRSNVIRLKGRTFIGAPDYFRLQMQIDEKGRGFVNYGTIWWRRQEATR